MRKRESPIYQANFDYSYRELLGEHILVPTGATADSFNGLVTLNESGEFLWRQLSQCRTRKELCQALAEEYGLFFDAVTGDVDTFLKLAVSKNVVIKK